MMMYVLVAVVAASRLLPHPPNVACIGALGLFAGCYLAGRRAYLVPLVALLASDIVGHVFAVPGMGFYSPLAMLFVYAGVFASVPVGRMLARHRGLLRFPAGSLVASTLFFVLSNLGVWLAGWYPMNAGGLTACYINAIPFFGYTLAGDFAFTLLLFGSWEFSKTDFSRAAVSSTVLGWRHLVEGEHRQLAKARLLARSNDRVS